MDDIANIPDPEFAPSGKSPGKQKWLPVRLQCTGLSIVGGYQGKTSTAMPVKTKRFEADTFVHISKNEPWLLRAAGGIGTIRGGLSRCRAIGELREKVAVAAVEEPVPHPGEKEPVPSPLERVDDDPMNQLNDISHIEAPKKKPRKGLYVKKPSSIAQSVTMPVLPLGHCQGQTVTVQVAIVGVSTYIHEDAVPWFVAYVADEHAHGGIPDTEDDTGESVVNEGNSSVPGLLIQWDFADDDGYVGTFVSGPLRYDAIIKSKLSTLTEAKWQNAVSLNAVSGSFDDASLEEKKKVVWLCIELHGQQLLQEINASDT